MAKLVQQMADLYEVVQKHVDPRSKDWFITSSILVPITIITVYLLIVKRWGPRFMANRAPYKIEPLVAAYNLSNILICTYLVFRSVQLWFKMNYSFLCQPFDKEETEDNREYANLVWGYAALKVWDLLDTIFFVLRKKDRHVSFLHVYHHSTMVFGGYLGCKFILNGGLTLIGVINSFVHIVMYSYYLYTTLFPNSRPSLGVKKSITLLQLTQFTILIIHNILPFLQPNCEVERFWCLVLLVQASFMFAMFADFYIKNYTTAKEAKKMN